MLEGRSVIDKDLGTLEDNSRELRLSEAAGTIEALNQEMATAFVYGNASTGSFPFNGLTPRFNDNTNAANKENIILGGGVGADNTSIWLVGWGPRSVHGVFPKGSAAGVMVDWVLDHQLTDATGKKFSAFNDRYVWQAGLVVKDWRYVVRIANIDVSDLIAESAPAHLFELMVSAWHKVPAMDDCVPSFYMNRTAASFLDRQAPSTTVGGSANFYAVEKDAQGRIRATFKGVPIGIVEAIRLDEALVT
jgi:Major capsid protein GP7